MVLVPLRYSTDVGLSLVLNICALSKCDQINALNVCAQDNFARDFSGFYVVDLTGFISKEF
jgi:hypothetical protein